MDARENEVLDLKFRGVQAQFEAQSELLNQQFMRLDEKISQTLEQAKKTNGRVNELEMWKNEHLIDTEKELLEYKFLKKYPKFTLIGIFILILIAIYQHLL